MCAEDVTKCMHVTVCLYAEKWRKQSLMFECGCVSLLVCICVFVKDTVYVKGKKKTLLFGSHLTF